MKTPKLLQTQLLPDFDICENFAVGILDYVAEITSYPLKITSVPKFGRAHLDLGMIRSHAVS